MASLMDKLKAGATEFGLNVGKELNKGGKLKKASEVLDSAIDTGKETINGMKDLGGKLVDKGKKMVTGDDVAEGLAKEDK